MFSEYASRFLAQSQSRIAFRQSDKPNETSRNPLDRSRRANNGGPRQPGSRSYLQRPILGSPYQSQLPFSSRRAKENAPLFYSATDQFREEDDEEEHEREAADLYALQQSRRHFVGGRLDESSEVEDDGSRGSELDESGEGDGREFEDHGFGKGRGIRSSWRGGNMSGRGRGKAIEVIKESTQAEDARDKSKSSAGGVSMVDIGLESTVDENEAALERDEAHPPDDLTREITPDDDPPAVQQFRSSPLKTRSPLPMSFSPQESGRGALFTNRHITTSDTLNAPPTISLPETEPPLHDSFWGSLYLISLVSLFASFFLVLLHTSAPNSQHPLGDTIYTTLHSSFHLLAVDTVIAVIVSLIWLALLRSFVRPLVYSIIIAVPVILVSFSLYPLISSYKGQWHGASVQDKAMRWLSFLPAIIATLWTYTVYRGRDSLAKSISILEFACKVLASNPALLAFGFVTLAGIVTWTWLWMGMFTRVFLGGHTSASRSFFILDASTWWLAMFFILIYLWTLAVGSGLQRAVTGATVSQWYFHRGAVPAPTSRQVVQAAFAHASTTLFGTICLSTLLSLLIRLPLLVLPRRVIGLLGIFTYSLVPTPIAILTNPLTLTYASIHSQPLGASSRGLSQMSFLSANSPTTTLHPRTFSGSHAAAPLLPYRLAKLLLHATRMIMSLALGFGGWVNTARTLSIQDAGVKGSMYAYIVGLIAGAIGWGVLGAMEGVLGGVVDAGVVCWGSESRGTGTREARFCREAGELFGGEGVGFV